MDADGLQGLEHLQGLADDDDFDPTNLNTPNFVNMESMLNGSEQIELSYAGGELGSLEEDLEEDTDDESAGAKTRQAPYLFNLNGVGVLIIFASLIQKGRGLEDPARLHRAPQPRI
jgi:hypothetical protein